MQRGYSFLELSIVILIIGLLMGGIVLGRNIVRASEVQTVVVDAEKYSTAVSNFRYKYMALPGDMPNATGLWGALDSTQSTCVTLASTDSKTCNGNGDGKIWYTFLGAGMAHELFHAWKHLSNAGMVDGKFSGAQSAAGVSNSHAGGVNAPESKISGGTFAMLFIDVADMYGSTTRARVFQTKGQHYLIYGSTVPSDPGLPRGPILSPEEAFSIDTKSDDGLPDAGRLRTLTNDPMTNVHAYDCAKDTDAGAPEVWAYDTELPGIRCVVVFETKF